MQSKNLIYGILILGFVLILVSQIIGMGYLSILGIVMVFYSLYRISMSITGDKKEEE